MVQLITFLLVVAVLVTLVLQNLNPVLGLVVLGRSTFELPFAVWLLGAIAIGGLCTLVIYQLAPKKRPYRPMGRRLSEPPPTDRFTDTPHEPGNRFQSQTEGQGMAAAASQTPPQNPYDRDWEEFRAPEQWEDWGQQTVSSDTGHRPSPTADDTMRDIESGWGDDDYETSGRFAAKRNSGPGRDWDSTDAYNGPEGASTQTYDEGWLYGNDSTEEPDTDAPQNAPQSETADENVYDANYRVIIPPYENKND